MELSISAKPWHRKCDKGTLEANREALHGTQSHFQASKEAVSSTGACSQLAVHPLPTRSTQVPEHLRPERLTARSNGLLDSYLCSLVLCA